MRAPRVLRHAAIATLLVGVALGSWGTVPASAGDLSAQLADKRAQLQHDRAAQASLTATLQGYSSRIEKLSRQVGALRDREATVAERLAENKARLHRARQRLELMQAQLHRALKALRQRLVDIYRAGMPDVVEVILTSRGFSDLVSREAYLKKIQAHDDHVATRARDLRDASRATVHEIAAVRAQLQSERDQLAQAEARVQARQNALVSERDRKQSVLRKLRSNGIALQDEISSIQHRIARRQAAAAAATDSTSGVLGTAPLSVPLGPIPPGQAISPFPASSPVTWGRTDQGVDGTTTPGSPLLAMGDGTVLIEHDPAGFGADYPVIETSFGSFYYGHSVPIVGNGAHVSIGQPIATAHYGTWGNSTTPGGFEIGAWPPGGMTAGAAIRAWLISLPRR